MIQSIYEADAHDSASLLIDDAKIMMIDDEQAILDNLAAFLMRSGFDVEQSANGRIGLEETVKFKPDVIVLDVMMPELDGREMLRILRANDDWTPVILLTQVGDATDRAMAITEGADDYLNKPYDPHELVARINSILRRKKRDSTHSLNSSETLTSNELSFDRKGRTAKVHEKALNLTPRATHLLEYLMLHPNELLHRERILDAVWGWNFVTGTRSVDARIVEVRKAIAEHCDTQFIDTVPGEGYRFAHDVK